jgi:hypothetical protein
MRPLIDNKPPQRFLANKSKAEQYGKADKTKSIARTNTCFIKLLVS